MPRSSRSAWRRSSSSPRAGSVAALSAQNRILVGAFRAPELASTLMSSVFNIGIAAGAALAAAALNAGMPVTSLPLIGFVAMAVASVIAVAAVLSDRR